MRKRSIKNTRVNTEVQRELSNIIRGGIKDPRVAPWTSVVAVEVAPDLKTCKAVSYTHLDVYKRQILDEKDYIDDTYIMEVSSPGLGRPLKKEKDFKRSLGKEVDIRTYRMIDKQKEFTGILKDYDKDTVTIELDDETLKTFEKGDIALIRLAFDF